MRGRSQIIIVSGILFVLAAAATTAYVIINSKPDLTTQSIFHKYSNLNFPVYEPTGGEFSVSDVSYSSGLLIYKVRPKNSSMTAVISQQAVPDDLQNSVPASDEQVATPYGNAAISLQPDRTTAVLIADKLTLISINAPVNFSQDSMKSILRSLKKLE